VFFLSGFLSVCPSLDDYIIAASSLSVKLRVCKVPAPSSYVKIVLTPLYECGEGKLLSQIIPEVGNSD
jgi:hypothetical protein